MRRRGDRVAVGFLVRLDGWRSGGARFSAASFFTRGISVSSSPRCGCVFGGDPSGRHAALESNDRRRNSDGRRSEQFRLLPGDVALSPSPLFNRGASRLPASALALPLLVFAGLRGLRLSPFAAATAAAAAAISGPALTLASFPPAGWMVALFVPYLALVGSASRDGAVLAGVVLGLAILAGEPAIAIERLSGGALRFLPGRQWSGNDGRLILVPVLLGMLRRGPADSGCRRTDRENGPWRGPADLFRAGVFLGSSASGVLDSLAGAVRGRHVAGRGGILGQGVLRRGTAVHLQPCDRHGGARFCFRRPPATVSAGGF